MTLVNVSPMTKRTIFTLFCTLMLRLAHPTPAFACAGDCGGDASVGFDDLVIGTEIALARRTLDQCLPLNLDGDSSIAVDELVAAVNAVSSGCPQPRLLALSREGRIASVDVAAPWSVRAADDLALPVASAKCRAGRCLIVHPSPADSISVVDAADLSRATPIQLDRGADPRDVTFVADDRVIISQYGKAELLDLDLQTRDSSVIDLSPLADEDGLPEALRLSHCGSRVFVQLRRVDHASNAPAAGGGVIAVIDLNRPTRDRLVDTDPVTEGIQGIALALRPNFDMPIDCPAARLYVAEPALLMQGGGGYEQVDLNTLTASELPIDTGAEVGGFEFVAPGIFWLITHTTTGPAPSSHLNIIGGETPETHNTFAMEHVNDLVLDRGEDLLFYPDPCKVLPANQFCVPGVYVFHGHSGFRAAAEPIDVDFEPIEVTISR